MNGDEKPLGVAIIICDKVITEAGTNNKTLISIFNNILSNTFPCIHHRMAVYVALTNATGPKQISLLLKLGSETVLQLGGKISFPDPNSVVELIFNLTGVPFIESGAYCFEVHADDDYIFESRFNVTKKTGEL